MTNYFKTMWSKAEKWLFHEQSETRQLSQQNYGAPPSGQNPKGIRQKLSRIYNYRIELEMKNWRMAVAQAEDNLRPRRSLLYRTYHRALEDDHLLSQIRTAIFTVRTGDYEVRVNGKSDENLKELFKRPWFRQFLEHSVMAEMWGHSLIEFDPTSMKDGEFTKVELIPRLHVRPEYGQVVINEHDEKGLPYREGPISKYMVEIGQPDDLGLLKVASRSIIRKDYSLGDWSKRNEKYGTPFMVVRTSSRDKKELDEKQRMAENFGSNTWAILDDQDQIDLLESNQAFTFQAFEKYADRVDKAISILINGQTGTTQEKAHVGAAEVHERILNTYTKDRLQNIQDLINEKLMPFLTRHGYGLANASLHFTDLEDEQQKPSTLDKPDEQELSYQGKVKALTAVYNGSKGMELDFSTSGLDRIIKRAIDNVYQKRLKQGQVDAQSWRFNVDQLWQAAQQGSKSFISLDYTDFRFEMLAQLRSNIHVFAAFKNYAQINDLAAALVDDQGRARSFNDFKREAESILNTYNKTWLRTEYELALSSAQMAVKWQDYQDRKELLPSIRYVTQNDERVRDGHQLLSGTILPVDDEFWDTYFPPNGYGCRCSTQQVANTNQVRPDTLPNDEQVPPIFRNNVGNTRQAFTQAHPFFSGFTQDQRTNLKKITSKMVYESDQGKKVYFDNPSGGFVIQQSASNQELESTARQLAKLAERIYMLKKVKDKPSPNLLRNDLLFHAITFSDKLDELLQSASSNANRILISLPDDKSLSELQTSIKNLMPKYKNVQLISVLHKGKLTDLDQSFWN